MMSAVSATSSALHYGTFFWVERCCRGAVRRMRTGLRYPYLAFWSGSEKAAPLGESSGADLLVGVAVLKVALRWKVVVDRGMD